LLFVLFFFKLFIKRRSLLNFFKKIYLKKNFNKKNFKLLIKFYKLLKKRKKQRSKKYKLNKINKLFILFNLYFLERCFFLYHKNFLKF
jgi:hypothetical protein